MYSYSRFTPAEAANSSGYSHNFNMMGDYKLRDEVAAWCEEHFGPPMDTIRTPGRWCHMMGMMISFRDETDAFAFRMRWC